jgi:hypothetical protein
MSERVKKECMLCGDIFTARNSKNRMCDKCRELTYPHLAKQRSKKSNFKDHLCVEVHQLKMYNRQNGTRLTYGQWKGQKFLGKIK